MRIFAFGTVRLDIHSYQNIDCLDEHQEIKIEKMKMAIGGSVYNTSYVLNSLRQDVTLYMLNIVDDFSDFIKLKLDKLNIKHIANNKDKNRTASSLIFIDEVGNKKMISCDGERQDSYILQQILTDIRNDDIFYTSFYEINNSNLNNILNILNKCSFGFVDLSPLIYDLSSKLISAVLDKISILSGTEDEYSILFKKLSISDYEELLNKYNLKTVFIKQGKNGATIITNKENISYKSKIERTSSDTTGCGDAFNGAALASILSNDNPGVVIKKAVDFATDIAYNGF